ncbi:MAG: hypothetical protein KDI60_06205 [Xanthomonadales bacterium]|nr:hypothetical protein [Xanthomonadales bacterium]MCP5474811.1 hypothetical protein [Rhodanobacteraceae bacterium]
MPTPILQIKRIVLFLISPFIALAYMAAIPVVGFSMLMRARKAHAQGDAKAGAAK